jgi:hypothetical protein
VVLKWTAWRKVEMLNIEVYKCCDCGVCIGVGVCTHIHTHNAIKKESNMLAQVHIETSRDPNQLTSWCIVLPEKLTSPQLIKFHGTGQFITAFTGACPYPEPKGSAQV